LRLSRRETTTNPKWAHFEQKVIRAIQHLAGASFAGFQIGTSGRYARFHPTAWHLPDYREAVSGVSLKLAPLRRGLFWVTAHGGKRPVADIRVDGIKRNMPTLLHEYWENEDGGQFGPVREITDKQRPKLLPNARFVFSLYASSWFEALQMEYDRLGSGPIDLRG
jgi:hypothetical protein